MSTAVLLAAPTPSTPTSGGGSTLELVVGFIVGALLVITLVFLTRRSQ